MNATRKQRITQPVAALPAATTLCDGRHLIRTVEGVLSASVCQRLIADSEASGFADAPITTARGFAMRPDVRNNTRYMIDDHALADRLWQRIVAHVPATLESGWRAHSLNERFRFYRYEPGQYFRWHFDGSYRRSDREESMLTLMLYLNGDFVGGATEFDNRSLREPLPIVPRAGRALIFTHAQLHQGAPVARGRKYVLRTDVMYRR